MESHDVAIIGGGIIGCAIARRLAEQGARIVIFERGQTGAEASWAAGGALIPDASHDATPELLDHWLTALRMYPRFVEALRDETGMPFEFRVTGHLVLASDESQFEALRRRHEHERAVGVRCELWSAEQVRAAEPAVAPGFVGALSFPDHGIVDNRRLVSCLALAAAKRGVTIETGQLVTGLLLDGERVVGVDICGEPRYAGAVVNAAGSWAGLIGSPGALPIAPAKGQILALETRRPLCQRIISSSVGSLVSRSDGRHIFGSTVETAGYDKRVTTAAVQRLLTGAIATCPELADAQVAETWAGLRPVAPDRQPILGAAHLEGLFVASGHFTMGILSAPAT
ncbi:MAG: glycine oxidase ThiO, partial [Dehalococcoidia bacterium]